MTPRIGLSCRRKREKDLLEPDRVSLSSEYIDAVAACGGAPIVLPPQPPGRADAIVGGLHGLILTGGGDIDPEAYGEANDGLSHRVHAERDQFEIALVHAALERNVPVLGICRGAQIINVALGGSLKQHISGEAPHIDLDLDDFDAYVANRHGIELQAGCAIATIFGTTNLEVNSLHHQAIDRLGDRLVAVGSSPDGHTEAVEAVDADLLAVQWHPEKILDAGGEPLFADIVNRARAFAASVDQAELRV